MAPVAAPPARLAGLAGPIAFFVVGVVALGPIGPSHAETGAPPSDVCHRPPDNPDNYRTLQVSAGSLADHLAHGDLPGSCAANCSTLCDDDDPCVTDAGVWDGVTERCTCSHTPVVCTALDQCHEAGECNAATGLCSNPPKADGTACDDGNAGTPNDVCVGGACTEGLPVSCKALRDAGTTASGVFWLSEPEGTAYQAYCDMNTDGGGWTAVFAGQNGSTNVFDHFDAGSHLGICDSPATHCLRRAPPSSASATELAVSCGLAMVRIPLTSPVRDWVTAGVQSGWQFLVSETIAGSVADPPNFLFTGQAGGAKSFVFIRNQFPNQTFAASTESAAFDFCNGSADQASLVRVFYR